MFTSNNNLPEVFLAAVEYNSKVNIKETENQTSKYILNANIQYTKLMCDMS